MQKFKNNIKKDKDYIYSKIHQNIELGIILGSGMTDISSYTEENIIIPYYEIPHFSGGNKNKEGKFLFALWCGKKIVAFVGRLHFYQGYSMEEVTYPVWLLKELGAHALISVNTAGGLNKSFEVGDIMMVRDHINLMGANPLLSIPQGERNPQFLDLSTAYDSHLMQLCQKASAALEMPIKEGILAAVAGPCYETPAEARMLKLMGADAVCMSSIPEAIIANYLNLRVLGLSLITNKSAADSRDKISHQSVLTVASRFQEQIYRLLAQLLASI